MLRTVRLRVIETAPFMAIAFALLFLTWTKPAPAQAGREQSIDKQVAALVEKTLDEKTEQQAFSDIGRWDVQLFQQSSSEWMIDETYPTIAFRLETNRQTRLKECGITVPKW
jgi:flagellar biosynthesis component FlhA